MAKTLKFDRDTAFDARPMGAQVHKQEELPNGGAKITIGCQSTRAQRWLLRLPSVTQREFELDAYGWQVFQLCNGQRPVRHIVKAMIQSHQLNPQEAQQAVAMFLQSMIRKGLVVMLVPKNRVNQ